MHIGFLNIKSNFVKSSYGLDLLVVVTDYRILATLTNLYHIHITCA